ncbi:tetratricopeptide repeat protein [Micromonospora violae]|uniref:Tetratricopeptide repeat protein n=1 Tax=Micromonospora violae TaxID=1278207 RepID=A0A4Q7ULI0_9ACTN|nr:tetratricopeptide repeat protein [Micromonospora violae]RZT82236.1 tetratricopeptide repeat protein [Micromonospora violae]
MADVPSTCPVYIGLAAPGSRSPNHAVVTRTIGRHLVEGDAARLPWFNTSPPPVLRILTAASWGRADAMVLRPDDLPSDLMSDSWRGLVTMLAGGHRRSDAETSVLADLLVRLGFVRSAARLLGIADGQPLSDFEFSSSTARAELGVLSRLLPRSVDLVALAAAASRHVRFAPRQRLAFVNFVMVRHGKAGADSPLLDELFAVGRETLEVMSCNDFDYWMARHTLYRAAAYIPFLRDERERTLELLAQAREAVLAARPRTHLERLSLEDHVFPMYETLARTNVVYGRLNQALEATDELVAISPWDYRTWFAKGQVLLRLGHFEDAIAAYQRVYALGGHPVGQAAYYVGFAHEKLGRTAESVEAYQLSHRVDPTVPAVREKLKGTSG